MIKPSETKELPAYFNNSAAMEITGISKDRLQYFVRLGLIVPAAPGFGRGKGHGYDLLNIHRIGFLKELDSIGLDAGAIRNIIAGATPNMLDPSDFDREKGSEEAWLRILAIFRSGVATNIRWFKTAQEALAFFYPGNKPESHEEFALIKTLYGVVLIDMARLWANLMRRSMCRMVTEANKAIERKYKKRDFYPAVERLINETRLLMSQGKYREAQAVSAGLAQLIKEKTGKKLEQK